MHSARELCVRRRWSASGPRCRARCRSATRSCRRSSRASRRTSVCARSSRARRTWPARGSSATSRAPSAPPARRARSSLLSLLSCPIRYTATFTVYSSTRSLLNTLHRASSRTNWSPCARSRRPSPTSGPTSTSSSATTRYPCM